MRNPQSRQHPSNKGKTTTPFPFKLIPRHEVAPFNKLFRKNPNLNLKIGGQNYNIRFEPENHEVPIQAPLSARVRMGDRIAFDLCPEEKLLNLMLSDVATRDDLETLSPELKGVALESALERLLDRIDRLSGARSTIERLADTTTKTDPAKPHIYFSLIRKKDAMRSRGYIRTDVAGLNWIADKIERLPAKTVNGFNYLSTAGEIDIGSVALTRSEFDDLEPNDIVLAGGAGLWEDRELHIRFSPDLALGGNLVESNRILIQEVISGNGGKMPDPKKLDPKSSTLPVDDIPVQLVFEIGRTDISMGDLKHLQPGYTVQLDESVTIYKPVTIKANGVAIGSGEIVLIEDNLGIRILEINKNAKKL